MNGSPRGSVLDVVLINEFQAFSAARGVFGKRTVHLARRSSPSFPPCARGRASEGQSGEAPTYLAYLRLLSVRPAEENDGDSSSLLVYMFQDDLSPSRHRAFPLAVNYSSVPRILIQLFSKMKCTYNVFFTHDASRSRNMNRAVRLSASTLAFIRSDGHPAARRDADARGPPRCTAHPHPDTAPAPPKRGQRRRELLLIFFCFVFF